MTIEELTDWIIRAGAVAGALYAIWLMLRAAVVNPIRKSIGEQMSPVTDKLKAVENKMTVLDTRMSDHIATHRDIQGVAGLHMRDDPTT